MSNCNKKYRLSLIKRKQIFFCKIDPKNLFLNNLKSVLFLFLLFNSLFLQGQNINSFSIKSENKNPINKNNLDSIYKNNILCTKYKEVVRLDTLFWKQYPKISLDSIPQLKVINANELAKKALDIKHSEYYTNQPFNLIGTYSESEMRNNTHTSQNIETKVLVYDPGFSSGKLPWAQTEKCYYKYKSADISLSTAEIWMISLVGEYSNLYFSLDYDFLRMYNFPTCNELGGDRRIWSTHNFNSEHDSDDYCYYKAYKKDSAIYVILVSTRSYSIMDKARNFNYNLPKDFVKPVTTEYKYLLINLNTNAIEKTGFYINNSHNSIPFMVTSYETSYKFNGNKYFLNHVKNNSFLLGEYASIRSISFDVDSVVNDPSKVKKIKESQADPRKVNYIDYFIGNNLIIDKIKD